jgi:magnesium-transporting ATPase (P-type)
MSGEIRGRAVAVERAQVFARLSPAHKQRIIRALQTGCFVESL